MSGILAQYSSLGDTQRAIERLRAAGYHDLEVFSPIPAPGLEEALGITSSPVRRWALVGGITGFVTAVALTALTALAYPLVTQGKAIVSLPAYFIIMFEMTILFTGLFGLLGLLHHTRKPARRLAAEYREAFSVDRFGILVISPEDAAAAEQLVRETGPEDVEMTP
ncbi:MAG: DUF3341 domain-containing protein [Gemmatimonadota bacterium]